MKNDNVCDVDATEKKDCRETQKRSEEIKSEECTREQLK